MIPGGTKRDFGEITWRSLLGLNSIPKKGKKQMGEKPQTQHSFQRGERYKGKAEVPTIFEFRGARPLGEEKIVRGGGS